MISNINENLKFFYYFCIKTAKFVIVDFFPYFADFSVFFSWKIFENSELKKNKFQ